MHYSGLLQAIDHFGGKSNLAKQLGVPRQYVNRWEENKNPLPFQYAVKIEILTNGKVNAERLCPDLLTAIHYYRKTPHQVSKLSLEQINTTFALKKALIFNDSLVHKIASEGVKKPIAVSTDLHLLFGYRRLQACKLLGVKSIPVRLINIESLLFNHTHNTINVNLYRYSERACIIHSLFEQIKAYKKNPQLSTVQEIKTIFNNPKAAFSTTNQRADNVLAKAIGLGSRYKYLKLKTLLQSEHPMLIKAIDNNEIDIHTAYTLANYSVELQNEWFKLDKKNRRYFLKHFMQELFK